MRLERQLTVGAPPDQVWAELLDVADVAACLPGAEVRALPGEPVVRGELIIGHNGASVRGRGTLRAVDADEDERTATLRIQGREIGGSALATALLRSHVATADGATTIHVRADLDVTGQRADAATVEAEAQRLLDAFSERLEARIRERAREPRPVPAPDAVRPEPAAAPAAAGAPGADAGGTPLQAAREGLAGALSPRAQSYGLAAGAAVALIVLLRALLRPRRHVTVSLKYRW
jgi:carbon monoxide dehydrogenase subunit G